MKRSKLGFNTKRNTWTGEVTDEIWGAHIGVQTIGNIHDPTKCEGRGCSIHHPSAHRMNNLPMTWRGDKHMFERQCICQDDRGDPYTVGHPDPDDVAFHISQGRDYAGVHGCDGCCAGRCRCGCACCSDNREETTQ